MVANKQLSRTCFIVSDRLNHDRGKNDGLGLLDKVVHGNEGRALQSDIDTAKMPSHCERNATSSSERNINGTRPMGHSQLFSAHLRAKSLGKAQSMELVAEPLPPMRRQRRTSDYEIILNSLEQGERVVHNDVVGHCIPLGRVDSPEVYVLKDNHVLTMYHFGDSAMTNLLYSIDILVERDGE